MSADDQDDAAVPMICRVCGHTFAGNPRGIGDERLYHQGRLVGSCNMADGALPKHSVFSLLATLEAPARWPFKPDGVRPEKEAL